MERFKFLTRMLVAAPVVFFLSPAFNPAFEHIVQKGETLYSIGRSYTISVDELCRENGMQKTDTLKAGQRLVIPNAAEQTGRYVVTPDDTLYSIARKFGMNVTDVKKLNNLSTDTIRVGQELIVSGRAAAPVWPVKASSVTYVSGKISGVQLEAQKDEAVTSISSGTVMFSGAYRGFGRVVFVQNPKGYVYVYTGLSGLSVQKGDAVQPGRVLGKTGVDTLSGKSRLTFMVYYNGEPLDPAIAPRG